MGILFRDRCNKIIRYNSVISLTGLNSRKILSKTLFSFLGL